MNRATGGGMTAKEYLSQAYRIDQRINSKLEQAEALRSLTQKVTTSYGGEAVSRTRNVSTLEDTIIRLIEAENELNSMIDELVDVKMSITECINAVSHDDYRLLLEKRYLCFQSWERIAIDLHYSARWVHMVHSRALIAIDQVLRKRNVLA